MACHGLTFSELVNKNIQVESDTGPVNPHVFLPHNDPNGEVTECTNCHQVHTMPPPKGYKDDQASLGRLLSAEVLIDNYKVLLNDSHKKILLSDLN